MIEHKKWKGSYRYNKEKYQKTVGSEQTHFDVELTSVGTNDFVGKIIDDPLREELQESEKSQEIFQAIKLVSLRKCLY